MPVKIGGRRPGCVPAGIRSLLLASAAALGLGGCGSSEQSGVVGTRQWGVYEVTVETRPWPPREGQNEVVVVVAGERHRPIYDAVVNLRAQESLPWVQAIEDGHVGVYRRAVRFAAGAQGNLQVQLQRGEDRIVLDFPVAVLAQR